MLIRLPAVAVDDQAQAAGRSQQQQDQPGCEIWMPLHALLKTKEKRKKKKIPGHNIRENGIWQRWPRALRAPCTEADLLNLASPQRWGARGGLRSWLGHQAVPKDQMKYLKKKKSSRTVYELH